MCNANYAVKMSGLTEPIDIYSEWIDRCEERNNISNSGAWSNVEDNDEEPQGFDEDEPVKDLPLRRPNDRGGDISEGDS